MNRDQADAPVKPLTEREMLQEEYLALYGDPRPGDCVTPDTPPPCVGDAPCTDDEALRKAWVRQIHERARGGNPRTALALSGGGIRSATFALGVLQGLARYGLLQQFDFLSTVSGGGYVGSWLTAWLHRERGDAVRGGPAVVHEELAKSAGWSEKLPNDDGRDAPAPGEARETAERRAGGPEPAEIHHLREYSNYLTPRVGLLSADGWTLAATYARNLLLNWAVMLPLLMAFLLVPRVYVKALAAMAAWQPLLSRSGAWRWATIVAVSVPAIISLVMLVCGMPSVNRGAAVATPRRSSGAGRGDGDADAARDGGDGGACGALMTTRAVALWIIGPMWLSATLASFARLTMPEQGQAPLFYLPFYAGFYGIAALFAAAEARLRRKPSPPRWFALLGVLVASGMLTGLFVSWTRTHAPLWSVAQHPKVYATLVVPSLLCAFQLLLAVFVGLSTERPAADDDREWLARVSAWAAIIMLAWAVACGIGLGGPALWDRLTAPGAADWAKVSTAIGSVVATGLGLLGGHSRSSAAPAYSRPTRSFRERVAHAIPALAAPIGVLAVMLALAVGASKLVDRLESPDVFGWYPRLGDAAGIAYASASALALGTLGLVAGLMMNSNRLSFHAVYRDRLIRAFLGASNRQRHPNPFTGFDRTDNVPMHHLRRLRWFTRDDLFDPQEGDAHWRVDGVARLLRARNGKLMDWLWQHAGGRITSFIKVFDRTDATPLERMDAVLDVLNGLLDDPGLHAEWVEELTRQAEAAREPVAAFPEIRRAYWRAAEDGCCVLLNRLILEEAFYEEVAPGKTTERRYFLKPPRERGVVPRPMHVANLALNLVAGSNLAWQQRKAAAFTISPLHSGFARGYRPTVDYGGAISLGTAITISGAAATPNMGYHSSPAVTFLMALFNVRLGWWLGNPAAVPERWVSRAVRRLLGVTSAPELASRDYQRAGPVHSLTPLVNEALGRTNDRYRYVYLSDGGHFENLGLYEMVRRRAHTIVVSDASCDPDCTFDDLGNAIRKVQIDFGVPIELREILFFPNVEKVKDGEYCAVAKIDYQAVDGPDAVNGCLVYLKPARHPHEPVDVFNYGETNEDFPHDPTANQWFSESQFESYRKLGLETIRALCGTRERDMTLAEFVEIARAKAPPAEWPEKAGPARERETVGFTILREAVAQGIAMGLHGFGVDPRTTDVPPAGAAASAGHGPAHKASTPPHGDGHPKGHKSRKNGRRH